MSLSLSFGILGVSACSLDQGRSAHQQAQELDAAAGNASATLDSANAQTAPAKCTAYNEGPTGFPPESSYAHELTVHITLLQPRGGATVGWSSMDGQRRGVLNPVYSAARPTYRGRVPAELLQLYVDGLAESEPYEARAQVDMRKKDAATLNIALNAPRQLVKREVVIRDAAGQPMSGVRGVPLLDGSPSALRVATMNYQQWISDSRGVLRVRSLAGDTVQLSLSVPLLAQPIERTLAPGVNELRLDGVKRVLCSFRCLAANKPSFFPGFVAVAELADGTCNRFNMAESDALSSGDIMLAWPAGTRVLTVSSSPYTSASIASPEQPCELHVLPERRCEYWYGAN